MGSGWRNAFCTSTRKDTSDTTMASRPESPSPRSYSRLKLFSTSSSSNPSAVRAQAPVQSDVVSPSLSLRCRTLRSEVVEEASGVTKLHCRTGIGGSSASPMPSPRAAVQSPASSNPCSPRSPSRFALLKNTLRLSRSRCGICLQNVKAVQGTAIFIAECSHAFHFPCIATHVRKQVALVCPVCAVTWRQVPLLSVHPQPETFDVRDDFSNDVASQVGGGDGNTRAWSATTKQQRGREMIAPVSVSPKTSSKSTQAATVNGYSDDEPLLSPGGSSWHFIPISEENDEEEEEEEEKKRSSGDEFQGFFATNLCPRPPDTNHQTTARLNGIIQVTMNTDVALLSTGRNHDKYVVAVNIKALSPASRVCRAPIDLVIVVDVGGIMTEAKFQLLKRSIRRLISSLTSSDRLSLVAFAVTAKRLLPLRRMTPQGQRSARRIIDRLVFGQVATSVVGDALRKATQILDDRRERNPVASIMLLADGQQQQQTSEKLELLSLRRPSFSSSSISCRSSTTTSSAGTRFAHIEIPVASPVDEDTTAGAKQEPPEDAFARCVDGLLSVVVHEVSLELSIRSGDVTSVYSISGQPTAGISAGGMVKLGDLYLEEERDLLVEIRIPIGLQQIELKAKYNYKLPASQEAAVRGVELLKSTLLPLTVSTNHRDKKQSATNPRAESLRNLFVSTQAITEARRLARLNDTETALHLLFTARTLLMQSKSVSADGNLRVVELELTELERRRQERWRRDGVREAVATTMPESGGGDALTPTSAWRAAERLAKLAIVRKSLNRVGDLHGFEDARF